MFIFSFGKVCIPFSLLSAEQWKRCCSLPYIRRNTIQTNENIKYKSIVLYFFFTLHNIILYMPSHEYFLFKSSLCKQACKMQILFKNSAHIPVILHWKQNIYNYTLSEQKIAFPAKLYMADFLKLQNCGFFASNSRIFFFADLDVKCLTVKIRGLSWLDITGGRS